MAIYFPPQTSSAKIMNQNWIDYNGLKKFMKRYTERRKIQREKKQRKGIILRKKS